MASNLEVAEFFQDIALGNLKGIRAKAEGHPELLKSFNDRSFGATPLTMACFGNHHAAVALLIELGADPNQRSDWHMGPWSPLHCAIYRRDIELAKFLLANGAALDVHTAAGIGDCAAVSKLLQEDPACVNERGGDGCQPLHFAETPEVANLLLEHGADIDGRCIDHYSTPVQYLCSSRPEVARYLLSVGAQPDIFSSAVCGTNELVESLLKNDPSLILARVNQTTFPPRSENEVHNILTFTIGSEATPLHAAVVGNQRETVLLLVKHGMSTEVRGGYDQATPLHAAAWNDCETSAEALLDSGADIEARSGELHNNTPAGWAIVSGADNVFAMLIKRGARQLPWFLDDARDACEGRFDQVSNATSEQRKRILELLKA